MFYDNLLDKHRSLRTSLEFLLMHYYSKSSSQSVNEARIVFGLKQERDNQSLLN